MGYHARNITKGELGEASKIKEEFEEFEDAIVQQNSILALCELADLYGAMDHFLRKNYPDLKMKDLAIMAKSTEDAFKDGSRKG